MKRVVARCPGSCGELIQGWVGDSEKLVTYGIDVYSNVAVYRKKQGELEASARNSKAFFAMKKTLETLKIPEAELSRLSLTITSELPIAKGMASSTADIAATCLATATFFNRKIAVQQIMDICLAIEATDSTPFSSLTLFDQCQGLTRESSGWRPDFYVLTLEPETQLVTEQFRTAKINDLFFRQRFQFLKVYNLYEEALQEKSLAKLGQAALASATLNQQILPKRHFAYLRQVVEKFQLLGINVAHSGTVLGLLLPEKNFFEPVYKELQKAGIEKDYPTIHLRKACYKGVHLR